MAIKIAAFNNKGGVGKTTYLMNLAFALESHLNRKILLVDADPQCNLTSLLCHEDEIEEVWNTPNGTLYSVMKPHIDYGKPLGEVSAYQVSGRNIWLFLGDALLGYFEDVLASSWVEILSEQPRGYTITSIVNISVDNFLNNHQGIDYVLYDLGPSLGSLNRAVILGVDFFIVPMTPDLFSLRGASNLGKTIGGWCKQYSEGLQCLSLREDVKPFVRGQPKFLGYIVQHDNNMIWDGPTKAYQKCADQIPETIYNDIIKAMQDTVPYNHDIPLDTALLGEIKKFYSLVPIAQKAHKPIFELEYEDGLRGPIFGAVDAAKEVFFQFAEAFEKQIRRIQT